jgi:hypothetical protein
VRHVWFGLALIAALFAALPMALPYAMNECQLHATQEAVDRCFAGNKAGGNLYFGTIIFAAVTATGLHLLRSRWRWLALIAVPVGPLVTTSIVGV